MYHGRYPYFARVDAEKKHFLKSLRMPFLLTALLWMVKFAEEYFQFPLDRFGVLPLHRSGLAGIILAPLIHADYQHLISNSLPFFILSALLANFYREFAFRILFLVWILSGLGLWLGGRISYHIGASGVVYGLAAFLFVSGILRRHTGLMAVSLLVVFLYGGLVWGLFPLYKNISWESHLYGLLAGIMLAFVYRKHGPQRIVYDWELEEDEEDHDREETNHSGNDPIKINYIITENKDTPGSGKNV